MTKHLLFWRIVLFAILFALLFFSCRALTPEQAAQGGHKKVRTVM
ncbi:MAG TPA: hypothetical protein VL095_09020 [Flavisolibacter sp.]|jgi:hypothetical protein|nr:hypothetical protein [Flavisolibacter sp.]